MITSNKIITLEHFLSEILVGKNPLQLLSLDESAFRVLPPSDNIQGLACGIRQTAEVTGLSLFDVFNTATVKHYDDDRVAYIFDTATSNYDVVRETYVTCDSIFGAAIHDDDIFADCTEENILKISKGESDNLLAGVGLMWPTRDYFVSLNYLTSSRQLSLSLYTVVRKEVDNNPKAHTILDLVNVDLDAILKNQKGILQDEVKNDNRISGKSWKFKLPSNVMDIFDFVTLNIFAQNDIPMQMDLVFSCSAPPQLEEFMKVFRAIVEIYGADYSGEKNLFPFEVDQIMANKLWTGRCWSFNEENSRVADDEEIAYAVVLDIESKNGLQLSIFHYNELVERFQRR